MKDRMKYFIMIVIMLLCGWAVYTTTVNTPETPMIYKIFGLIFITLWVFGLLLYKYEFIGSSSSEDDQENK